MLMTLHVRPVIT